MHMIALCLIRIAMFDASQLKNAPMSTFSFARALTEARLFLSLLVSGAVTLLWQLIWEQFVRTCARQRVKHKPGRQFSRDRQQYRRKSRGLEKTGRGRKSKFQSALPESPQPELLRDGKGRLFLLS
jgi:hypothetical protein